jgi:predicted nuclease of predicted toxin-antitoxin system
VRFLVDAQLPPALARWLSARGFDASHVADFGMEAASDQVIWRHATKTGAVLITKDEDFVVLKTLQPDGPRVVWLRIGNTTKRFLLARMEAVLSAIADALGRGEQIIEIQ